MSDANPPTSVFEPLASLNVQVRWLRLLRIAGELDLATAPLIRDAAVVLAGSPAEDLVIDMAGVTFIDAAGVGALMTLAHAQSTAGAQLTFVGVPALCREVFALAEAIVLVDAANQSA